MKLEEFERVYWNYYLLLENRVLELEPYIEFAKSNYNTYSLKIKDLLISVCCEVEQLFILIIGEESSIEGYVNFLNSDNFYGKVKADSVKFKNIDTFHPFVTNDKNQLFWWKAHNSLKHNRVNSFLKANLENLLNALAGLYLLEIYYYNKTYFQTNLEETTVPNNVSKIFSSEEIKSNICNPTLIECDSWDETC